MFKLDLHPLIPPKKVLLIYMLRGWTINLITTWGPFTFFRFCIMSFLWYFLQISHFIGFETCRFCDIISWFCDIKSWSCDIERTTKIHLRARVCTCPSFCMLMDMTVLYTMYILHIFISHAYCILHDIICCEL